MSKYQNKYRVESTRLKNWDYSNAALYFITICVFEHKEYFGQIHNCIMELNEFGKICDKCWCEIPIHYTNVELDLYVIMPDHMHGIIIINDYNKKKNNIVETPYMASLKQQQNEKHTLGDIIGKFKAAVTREVHKNGDENFR